MIGICVGLLHKRQYDYLCTGCLIWKKQPVHNQQLSRRCLLWRGNEVGSWSGLGEERFRDSQFDIVGWGGGIFVGGLQYPSKLRQYDFLCTVSALRGKWTVIVLLLCLFGQVRKEVVGRQEVARLLRQCCGSRSDRWRQWSWHLSGLFFATLACFQKVEDFLRLSKPFFDTQLAEIVPKFGHFWWLYYVLALEWWHLRWTSRGLYVFLSPSCSLSKTTKLILLDSLLQEVCIKTGLTCHSPLSSLRVSVSLFSHKLLYSGLKKVH